MIPLTVHAAGRTIAVEVHPRRRFYDLDPHEYTVTADGRAVGSIRREGGHGGDRDLSPVRWYVRDAGLGVQADRGEPHPDLAAAVRALLAAREQSPALAADGGGLTGFQRAVLDLEGRAAGWPRWRYEDAVADLLDGAPAVRYAQTLNALLDDPRAAGYAPVTVARLRRVRDSRRGRREGRRGA